jgi:hypothetical protein
MTDDLSAGDDVSVAGASARAEFERRQKRHQGRVRRYWPWLLSGSATAGVLALAALLLHVPLVGLLLVLAVLVVVMGVVALPDSTLSWATGSEGEALTARALEQLKIDGFVILHDRRIPGSPANIDHIVIGPPGVAIVETKSYSGRLRVRGDDVYVAGRRKTLSTVEEARREAVAVNVALAGQLERRGLKVRPILCVHRADLPLFGASPAGVSIVDGHGLVKLLREAPPRLSAEDVREFARIANERLRPAAARMPPLYGRAPVPPRSDSTVAFPAAASSAPADDEQFMPPVRREQLQAAREARARATDRRQYWTSDGLAPGNAPPTIPPDEPR